MLILPFEQGRDGAVAALYDGRLLSWLEGRVVDGSFVTKRGS